MLFKLNFHPECCAQINSISLTCWILTPSFNQWIVGSLPPTLQCNTTLSCLLAVVISGRVPLKNKSFSSVGGSLCNSQKKITCVIIFLKCAHQIFNVSSRCVYYLATCPIGHYTRGKIRSLPVQIIAFGEREKNR